MGSIDWNWEIDGWIVAAGILCAVASSLVGCLLILRRMSLMGDAISHAVLPGIGAAFMFSGSRGTLTVFIGAAVMGLTTVWLIELIRRLGRVEESAAIGVVFTALFALGLVIIARTGDKVDLDPSCVLYGNLETVILDPSAPPFEGIPRVILTLGCICLINLAVIVLFYKQWQLTTFDPALADAQGFSSSLFHYILAALVAITCIASFEAVGNILVVAMLVVPAAAAFLLCNRLHLMIAIAVGLGSISAILGHLTAISLPAAFGLRSVNSAACMAVVCGIVLAIAAVLSPKAGLLIRFINRRKITAQILGEDIMSLLFRNLEQKSGASGTDTFDPNSATLAESELAEKLKATLGRVRAMAKSLARRGWITYANGSFSLTKDGMRVAQNLVRSHRLWEQYLLVEAGVSDPRLHLQAESLEHFTSPTMRDKLDLEIGQKAIDPHGRSIPPEG